MLAKKYKLFTPLLLIFFAFLNQECEGSDDEKNLKNNKILLSNKMIPEPEVSYVKKDSEGSVKEKVKSVPKAKLKTFRKEASSNVEANLIKVMSSLSTEKSVPEKVKSFAKQLLEALKKGTLSDPMSKSLPKMLSGHRANQVNVISANSVQLQNVLQELTFHAPPSLKGPLKGLLDYLKATGSGLNSALSRILAGTPNLLNGAVNSLVGNLGIVGDTVGGSIDNLSGLLGGLLAGLG